MSEPLSRTVALPDLAATEALAAKLAALAKPGDSLLLEGDLGAGKTAFARAFLRAAAADPALEVPSPTFTLVQIYETRIGPVFHYDLWRLDGSDALVELDWDDARDGIVLVEWPDRLGPLRPDDALVIAFRLGEGEAREATLTGPLASWPGLARPSTTGGAATEEDVDGRAKPSHDTGDTAESDHGAGAGPAGPDT
jgi:tRNA threonylcarbamoyladenosine biosynthesis protein TsaE